MQLLASNPEASFSMENFPQKGRLDYDRALPQAELKEARPDSSQSQESFIEKVKTKLKHYAGIIDSRESITRLILDLTALDIPTIIAGATRNWSNFLESCLEGGVSGLNLFVAPFMTKFMAKMSGLLFLDKEDQKHYDKLVRFYRKELHDGDGFGTGVERIIAEEPKDLERISKLYGNMGNEAKARDYQKEADELKQYFTKLQFDPSKLKSLINFKETTLLFESCLEGGLWGSFGLLLRWFRKNVLKLDSFSGSSSYVNKDEAKKLGQDEDLKLWQKALGIGSVFLAPVTNLTIMNLCRNREAVKNSKFLKLCDEGMDMTHGLFPKLGLLFSFTTVPKWIGALATVQGKDELIERIMKLATVMPSWWLGHRVTNGRLAKSADRALVKKYGVEAGIMLEKDQLDKIAPEPAKIHHVLDQTEHNKELQAEAKSKHAQVLYGGLGLHSLGVLAMTLFINQVTKWRVKSKLSN